MRTVAVAVLIAATVAQAGVVPVHGPPPGAPAFLLPAPPAAGVVTACWLDYRYFRNLTTGVVDYCRGGLGYHPGALDCYQFTDRVCSVFLPTTLEWIETRQQGAPFVFPCPDAPQPPVCPRLTW